MEQKVKWKKIWGKIKGWNIAYDRSVLVLIKVYCFDEIVLVLIKCIGFDEIELILMELC